MGGAVARSAFRAWTFGRLKEEFPMRDPLLTISAALLGLQLVLPGSAIGQTPKAQTSPNTTKGWTPPRTPWGHPDISGTFSNVTIVPLERPANFGSKAELTDAEVAERVKTYKDTLFAKREGDTGFYNDFWWEWGKDVKRTSLIVDPPDGRLPLTPQARAQADAALARFARPSPAGPEDLNSFDRCITRSMPGSMLPGFYNHNYEIFQTPEYVVLRMEMIHDVRIIPLDNRPHLGSNIRQWLGDSRGHWEGNTLVVETTNLNDKVTDHGPTYFGAGRELRLVERLTRVDADTVDYRFTVEAPSMFTKPWTAAIPLYKIDSPIFEYACHEGNYAMPHSLSGARADEARSTGKPQ
jgi:hypothetical protein